MVAESHPSTKRRKVHRSRGSNVKKEFPLPEVSQVKVDVNNGE